MFRNTKIFLIVLQSLISNCFLLSQDWFNEYIDVDKQAPFFLRTYVQDGTFIIPYDFNENNISKSSIVSISSLGNSEHYNDSIKLAVNPLVIANQNIYSIGYNAKYPKQNVISITKLESLFFSAEDYWEFKYDTNRIVNGDFILHDGYFYILNTIRTKSSGWQGIEITKVDFSGTIIWSKKFDNNIAYSYAWSLDVANENELLVTLLRRKPSDNLKDVVFKISLDGNIIWEYSSNDIPWSSASPMDLEVLTDSIAVYFYDVDRSLDSIYLANQWSLSPTILRFIDSQTGLKLNELELPTMYYEDLRMNKLNKGKGEYFFAIGYLYDAKSLIHMAIVSKYNFTGDLLWTKKFQHPNFTSPGNIHFLHDIHENEDGSIVVSGTIRPEEIQDAYLWMFKINEYGCFTGENCSDDILLTNTVGDGIAIEKNIRVYPNPISDRVNFDFDFTGGEEIKIFDFSGKIVFSKQLSYKQGSCDISTLPAGNYLLQISTSDKLITRVISKI